MQTDHPANAPANRRTGEPTPRRPPLALLGVFLGLIALVPISQTARELARGERVQFTDVFRYAPTSANLRQHEDTLKEKSWVQQTFRPVVQRLLFRAFGDAGAKAVVGREGWLFYRPDVRYLVEGNRSDVNSSDSRWVQPTTPMTQRESVVRAIRRFRDQLKERGIELLVVPVPGKPSVYPDLVTRRASRTHEDIALPTSELLSDLRQHGVATVDLLSVFRLARGQASGESDLDRPTMLGGQEPWLRSSERGRSSSRGFNHAHTSVATRFMGRLYLAHDTHWTPLGARLAAEAVAGQLQHLSWAPTPTTAFRTTRFAVERWGDILEMMQIRGLRGDFVPERVECEQVLDPALGPLVPGASERPGAYRYPVQKASVLVLGDSFSRIYQYPEPRSLGVVIGEGETPVSGAADRQTTKRLLPGSAGFVSHLARALQAPVDAIVSDGGASTDVRRKLSVNPEMLEGKRVVVWEFVERDIALGQAGWGEAPLPVELGR